MKELPWITLIVAVAVVAVLFRYQVVLLKTPEGERSAKLDRLSGTVELLPVKKGPADISKFTPITIDQVELVEPSPDRKFMPDGSPVERGSPVPDGRD
jgi:hypothetical protein